MNKLYDKKGYPIEVGDLLKVFHFVAAVRREKIYMYKQVIGISYTPLMLIVSHMDNSTDTFRLMLDNSIRKDIEILQGFDDFKTRDRIST